MERVVEAFHAGAATRETAVALEALIAAVEDYNAEVQDVDIAADLEMLRLLRDNLALSGISAAPSPPADPWPAD